MAESWRKAAVYNQNDCDKIEEIVKKELGEKRERFLINIEFANCYYKERKGSEKLNSISISRTDFFKKVKSIKNKMTQLEKEMKFLVEEKSYISGHVNLALMSALLNGQNLTEAPDDMVEKVNNSSSLILANLKVYLNLSLSMFNEIDEDSFEYESFKDYSCKRRPETVLIKKLSEALDIFGPGGYTRGSYQDQNSAQGWRIECLQYLLKRLDVEMHNNQVLDALTNK